MLLAIDIGNSQTKFGLFSGDVLVQKWHCRTHDLAAEAFNLKAVFSGFSNVAVSSVVPKVSADFLAKIKSQFQINPFVVSHDKILPFSLRIQNPNTFGADRLASLAAVAKSKTAYLVIDLGTFLTIDGLNQNQEALGGIIFPGLSSCAEIYTKKSSNLPEVVLKKPTGVFGFNTETAIQSGLVNGFILLIRGFLTKMADQLDAPCKIMATGGGWPLLQADFPDAQFEPDLTLIGIQNLFEINQSV